MGSLSQQRPVRRGAGRPGGTPCRRPAADPPLCSPASDGSRPARERTGALMRFGLVGTGHWARVTHAPGVAAAEGAQLVGVWGRRPDGPAAAEGGQPVGFWERRPDAAAALAEAAGITAYDDYAAMLDDVDAVAFA